MVVVTFRNRLAEGIDEVEYGARTQRLVELVQQIPGFRSVRTYTAPDGERLALVEFDDVESLRTWREHPEHREAQRLGRELYYREYHLQICEVTRESHKEPPA